MTSTATSSASALWSAPCATAPIRATVTIPGSKSLSNRYLILAALGSRTVRLIGLLRSRDTELMMDALRALGVRCESEVEYLARVGPAVASSEGSIPREYDGIRASQATTVYVTPPSSGVFTGHCEVFCGLAGTVMRFVPCLALFADGPVRFDGDRQAYRRPMRPVLDGLRQLGAAIAYHGEPGFLPFTITPPAQWSGCDGPAGVGRGIPGARFTTRPEVAIDSSASSQFISGLLLIASRLPCGLGLVHVGSTLPSLPHIRMTMQDVDKAGGSVEMTGPGRWVVPHARLDLPSEVVVEPDLSNAAPFLGAAMITGGVLNIPHWPYQTTQPGGLLPGILSRMGTIVTLDGRRLPVHPPQDASSDNRRDGSGIGAYEAANGTLSVRSHGAIRGLGELDLSACGEIAPSIAALAALADAPMALIGIGHLRGHETNRLAALVTEIRRVGACARELPDGIEITPVARDRLHGAVMQTYADHRMATFAAMLGLAIPGVRVTDIDTTRKTIPDFPNMWEKMLES